MSFSFGSQPTNTASSSFGFSTPAKPASTGGFTFGSTAAAPAAPATNTGFSFGTTTPSAAPAATGGFGGFGTSTTAAPTTGGFSFGSTTTTAPAVPAAPAAGGFSFGSTTAPAPAAGGFSFGSTTTAPATAPATGGFNFGSSTTTPAPATGGFTFGSTASAPASTTGGFSFGSTTTAPASNTGGFSFGNTTTPATTGGFSFGNTQTAAAPTGNYQALPGTSINTNTQGLPTNIEVSVIQPSVFLRYDMTYDSIPEIHKASINAMETIIRGQKAYHDHVANQIQALNVTYNNDREFAVVSDHKTVSTHKNKKPTANTLMQELSSLHLSLTSDQQVLKSLQEIIEQEQKDVIVAERIQAKIAVSHGSQNSEHLKASLLIRDNADTFCLPSMFHWRSLEDAVEKLNSLHQEIELLNDVVQSHVQQASRDQDSKLSTLQSILNDQYKVVTILAAKVSKVSSKVETFKTNAVSALRKHYPNQTFRHLFDRSKEDSNIEQIPCIVTKTDPQSDHLPANQISVPAIHIANANPNSLPAAAPAPAAGGFSFGTSASTAPATGGFSFGSAPATTAPATGGFSFGSTSTTAAPAPATGGFSFGSTTAAPATTTPATGGFSFGTAPAAPAPATSGFSFGAPTPAPSGFSTPAPSTNSFSFSNKSSSSKKRR